MSQQSILLEEPTGMLVERDVPVPNKLFFIQSSSGDFSDQLCVLEISSCVALSTFQDTRHDAFYKAVEEAAKDRQNDGSAWVYELGRRTFSSNLQIYNASNRGNVVAELHLSILKHYGAWKLRFPPGSPHCSHDVDIRAISILRKQETFIKDGTLYVWDMTMGGKRGQLYKTVDEKRVLVGGFEAKTWFRNSCVLVMDTKEVDEVVALGSCVAALNRDI